MRLSRLKTLIETHGADPARWPAALRRDAEALLARSAEACAVLGEAQRFEDVLDDWQPVPPAIDAAGLAARIAATPQPRPAPSADRQRDWRISIGWSRFAGLATACAVGFVLGWTGLVGSAHLPDADDHDPGGSLFAAERPIW
jgi:hypothetical protein